MKKSERMAAELRTKSLYREAAADEEIILLRLGAAEHAAALAKLRREVQAEREARLAAEKRLVWVTKIACNNMKPWEIGDG